MPKDEIDEFINEYEEIILAAAIMAHMQGQLDGLAKLGKTRKTETIFNEAKRYVTGTYNNQIVNRGGSYIAVIDENNRYVGKQFKAWLSDFEKTLRKDIEAILSSDKSVAEKEELLKKYFDNTRHRAATAARTETQKLRVQGELKEYKRSKVAEVRYVCGANPCIICQGYCGQVYKISNVPFLPLHPNGVCDLRPI